jgi:hypothetical protein
LSFIYEERPSDSPYLEAVTRGRAAGNGSTLRPAEVHWHMVFTKFQGKSYSIVVGPLSTSGVVHFTEGAEILWVRRNGPARGGGEGLLLAARFRLAIP